MPKMISMCGSTIKKMGRMLSSLKYRVCTRFENNIKNRKGFNSKWITGCEKYKLSAARDHCEGGPHKHAMKCYLKAENTDYVKERVVNQSSIIESFTAGDQWTAEQVKKKFKVAYFVAKEEMAFKKYPAILKLVEMHGGHRTALPK